MRMENAIIYNRVSTTEQNPELQVDSCKRLSERLGFTDCVVMQEHKSAFKDNVHREVFEALKKEIQSGNVKHLFVWDLDRLYRNRKKLLTFFQFCKAFGCKVHSVRQDWLDNLHKIPEPFDEIVHDIMLQVMGWVAEDESSKKSERVKNAVRRKEGKPTESYKGRKWGRKPISNSVILEVLKLRKQGKTLREIAGQVHYWDKSNHQRPVSLALVHKIIAENAA